MTAIIAAILVSYLLGSVIGSLLIGRFRGVDIRTLGSGNPGGTNALRTQGLAFGLGVMVIDIGKGALAAGPVAWTAAAQAAGAASASTVQVLCAAAAVAGHVWPVFHRFRGGKGAATLVGAVAVIAPVALVPAVITFVLVLVLSGFVGLSTMFATAAVVAWAFVAAPGGLLSPIGAFALAMFGLIVFTHRINIERMRAGTEHCFEHLLVLRKLRR